MMSRPELSSVRERRRITVTDQAHKHPIRRRKDARPGELVRAALDAFVEKGFAATSLDDVAARAGVSKGTIYRYFRNKDNLFNAAIQTGLEPAIRMIEVLAEQAMMSDQSPVELLRNYAAVWQDIMRDASMANLLKCMVAESGLLPEVLYLFDESVVRPSKALMAHIVAAGIAGGEFHPVTAEMAADMFFSLIWRCAFTKVWCGLHLSDRFLEESFEVLIRGVIKVPSHHLPGTTTELILAGPQTDIVF